MPSPVELVKDRSFINTEVILGLAFAVVQAVGSQLGWPPFPEDAAIAVYGWIGARIAEKTVGPTDTNGKRAWGTIGFYFVIGFAVAKRFMPNLPDSVLNIVLLIVGGDTVQRVGKNVDLTKLLPKWQQNSINESNKKVA